MKRLLECVFLLVLCTLSPWVLAESSGISLAGVKTLKIDRGLSEDGKACITCHQQTTPGHVAD